MQGKRISEQTNTRYTVRVPWGAWDLKTGVWIPNHKLKMSAEEQHAANVEAGYSCECGFLPSLCKVHK